MLEAQCPLCKQGSKQCIPFFFHCRVCDAHFLDAAKRLAPVDEKARYEEHNNDVADPRYREFVRPLVESVARDFPDSGTGLDFGAGTGPVLATMLRERGYAMDLYDPLFHPDVSCLKKTYDFIVASEVVEHFFDPAEEFRKLHARLGDKGRLYLLTLLWNPTIDFESWYYRRDPTHVIFYSAKTFEWIRDHFGFKSLAVEGPRQVTLQR